MKKTKEKLYTEIFRYDDIDLMILPDRIRTALKSGLTTNLFLYGPAGTGKSTTAGILCKGRDVLHLNGSKDNGIDTIRTKVVKFSSSYSVISNSNACKVIWIDEADGLTDAAWDALRDTIEHFADHVRFVCTCNKIDKIPVPIKSRFNCIPFYPINSEEASMMMEGFEAFVKQVLDTKKIEYTNEDVHAFVESVFPDMRTILNSLQSFVNSGSKTFTKGTVSASFDTGDLFNLIMTGTDPVENYKFVMTNYSTNVDDAMVGISKGFVSYFTQVAPQLVTKIPYLVITIAEYMAQLPTAIDKCVVLMACVYKLQLMIRDGQA